MQTIKNTFSEKLYECNKHKEKIKDAKEYLEKVMPLDVDKYTKLGKIESSFIDQLSFRFSKLQDTMGESLFQSLLIMSEEDVKKMTFLDILNRLEELQIVNKNEWLKLREVRNEIAHEYSFNQEEVVDNINLIYTKSDRLLDIYEKLFEFIRIKLGSQEIGVRSK